MTHGIVRLVAVLGMAVTLVAVPVTAHAAAPPTAVSNGFTPEPVAAAGAGTQSTPFCPLPYLATAYGPLAQCTEIANVAGRPAYYSPITGGLTPLTDYYPMYTSGWLEKDVWATDGIFAHVRGYAALITGFGAVVFCTQYLGNQGRWGNFNLHTQLFYPSSGWLPVV